MKGASLSLPFKTIDFDTAHEDTQMHACAHTHTLTYTCKALRQKHKVKNAWIDNGLD